MKSIEKPGVDVSKIKQNRETTKGCGFPRCDPVLILGAASPLKEQTPGPAPWRSWGGNGN